MIFIVSGNKNLIEKVVIFYKISIFPEKNSLYSGYLTIHHSATLNYKPASVSYHVEHPLGVVGKVMGSMLGLNCVIAKDVKSCTSCYYVISMSRRNALTQNRCNSIPCTVKISRQRSCNERVGCLLCRIYEGDGY